jgi:hypothetical protein
MRLDGPLSAGGAGGHGPIRYFVSAYEAGKSVRFTFTSPKGFNGTHEFKLEEAAPTSCRLTHSISMRTTGWDRLSWPLVVRPLHDALIEDALARAEAFATSQPPVLRAWSPWVKLLRLFLRGTARNGS